MRGWRFVVLAILACVSTACVKRVQLPESPPFPSTSASSGSVHEPTIRQQIKQKEPQFWQLWENRWQLKPLTGKIFVTLQIQHGQIVQCQWHRSQVQGTLQTATGKQPPRPVIPRLCEWFTNQSWPKTAGATFALQYVLHRSE